MQRGSEAVAGGGGRWLVPAALLSVYLIWGSTYFAIRVVLEGFPPFLMAGGRFLVAGALLLGWARWRGAGWPTRTQWISGAKVGALLLFVGNGCVVFAEQSVASGLTAVLVATTSLWATLFAGLFGEWPARRQWIGLVIGLAGVALLNFDSDLRGSPLAAGALLLASLSWSFGSVWSRRLDLAPGPMASATQMLCAGVMLLALGASLGERWPSAPGTRPILALVYLTLFGSIVGFSSYTFLVRHTSAAVATSYAYVNPVVAVLIGVTLGAERLGAHTVAALVVIVVGVALVALLPGRKAAVPAPSAELPPTRT
ncbi:MAG: drug/metabolite exporter YedA [Myxococcaceae bacterium]